VADIPAPRREGTVEKLGVVASGEGTEIRSLLAACLLAAVPHLGIAQASAEAETRRRHRRIESSILS